MTQAHIIYIADVYCPWCFGFGPIMRQLADAFPQFPVRVIGGNLMAHETNLIDYAANDPGLYDFWLKVEHTTGRSLAGALADLRGHLPVRMYSPGADLILMALKQLVPGNELEQILMLEDMFYGEGLDIFSGTALQGIATRWNIPVETLQSASHSPQNEAFVEADLDLAAELMGEITAYPSVLLVRDEKIDAVSRGFVHYPTVEKRFEDAMAELGLEEIPAEFCSWHGSCILGERR